MADFVDRDELLMAYEKALECCENENEQMKMKMEEMEEKERESQRANEAERETPKEIPPVVDEINEDTPESNCLQLSQR